MKSMASVAVVSKNYRSGVGGGGGGGGRGVGVGGGGTLISFSFLVGFNPSNSEAYLKDGHRVQSQEIECCRLMAA